MFKESQLAFILGRKKKNHAHCSSNILWVRSVTLFQTRHLFTPRGCARTDRLVFRSCSAMSFSFSFSIKCLVYLSLICGLCFLYLPATLIHPNVTVWATGCHTVPSRIPYRFDHFKFTFMILSAIRASFYKISWVSEPLNFPEETRYMSSLLLMSTALFTPRSTLIGTPVKRVWNFRYEK